MAEKEIKKIESTGIGILSETERALLDKITGGNWKKYTRVTMAALGILPWIGSILGAVATLSSENEQGETNRLLYLWIKEHELKLKELSLLLQSVFARFDAFGDRIKARVESDEYISLVRKSIKMWDHAETMEKKEMLRKIITNAGGISIVQDDWVRMFLEWIEEYHELHFKVIGEIHRNPGISRRQMWLNIKGIIPRDDSAEADLFKLLIDDLTRGRVIRQRREVNAVGQFYKKSHQRRSSSSDFMESPFDTEDPYVLTELGSGFVSYVMNELNVQIESGSATQ